MTIWLELIKGQGYLESAIVRSINPGIIPKPAAHLCMKTKRRLIGRFHALSFVVLIMLLAHTTRAIVLTNEFWISTNTPTLNLGTLEEPFDGSTAASFDAAMDAIPANSVVHILAGVYQTAGSDGWLIKTGQKIIGSGIDATIIQLLPGAIAMSKHGMASLTPGTNMVVSDFTMDMNNNLDVHGVLLFGHECAIRRVKLINAGSTANVNEVFLLQISNAGSVKDGPSEGNVIEECEVSNFTAGVNGSACSAIAMDNGDYHNTNYISGAIRKNRLFLPSPSGEMAINSAGYNNVIVEDNYINGAAVGFYGEAGATNVIVRNNVFKNVRYGISHTIAPPRVNLTIAFNNIQLAYSPTQTRFGIVLGGGGNPSFTNITIIGNTIGFDSLPGATSYGVAMDFTTGLVMANNSIDSSLIYNFGVTCSNINVYDNTTLTGDFITSVHQTGFPLGAPRRVVSGNATAGYNDRCVVELTANSIITLPKAAGHAGKEFIVIDESGGGNILVVPSGTDKINGTTFVLISGAYGSRGFSSDGANWFTR